MQQYSQNLASNIVGELFDKAWHDYSLQQFLNKNLTNYSALKSLKFVDHVQE